MSDQELQPYALGTFAAAARILQCESIDESAAVCTGEIIYEILPDNQHTCRVEIAVEATHGTVGPKPWNDAEVEQKDFQASDGTFGRTQMRDTSECDAAYEASAG